MQASSYGAYVQNPNPFSPSIPDQCLLPLTRARTTYNLRNQDNITVPPQRTTTYQNSFCPQTIKDWNNLNLPIRHSPSIQNFKENLKKSSEAKTNKLYLHDSSKAAINQMRMRLGLSGLSSHHHNYKHIEKPTCPTCGAKTEDPTHYFVLCPTFAGPRPNLLQETCDILFSYNIQVDFTLRTFCEFFIKTLLEGSRTLTLDDNRKIFKLTQNFIQQSHRFL